MLKKSALFIVICFFLRVNLCFALDWKMLHEKADNMSLSDGQALVKEKAGSIEDLYVLGLVFLNLHRDKEAGEVFSKVLNLSPETIEAKWGTAEVLRRQHHADKSQNLLKEVLKESPEFSPAYITLAYIRYTQTNFNEAVRLAIKVLDRGEGNVDLSNHVRAHLIYAGNKGMIAHYGGPVSKIINGTAVLPSLKAAERLQPESAQVKFGLGSFYLLAPSLVGGDLVKAEEYLKQAIAIDTLFTDAYVRLGQLYKKKGDSLKYNEYLDKALSIDPLNELALDIKNSRCKFICLDKD
jgi:tetratricopeptide (TPR) repeat protein